MVLTVSERAALLRAARSELQRLRDHSVYLHERISKNSKDSNSEAEADILDLEVKLLSTAIRLMWIQSEEDVDPRRREVDLAIEELCKKYNESKKL